MPLPASLWSLTKAWLWSFLAFGLLALVLVGQFVWVASLPAAEAWRAAARDLLPWAVLTPLLFRLTARLPLERGHWKTALPAHGLCAAAALALCTLWAESVLPPGGPPQRSRQSAPGAMPARPPGDNLAPPTGQEPLAPSGQPDEPTRRPHNGRPDDRPNAGHSRPDSGHSGPDGHGGPGGHGPGGPRGGPPLAWIFFLLFRLPIYVVIISVAHALHFYRRSQERELRALGLEASLAKARLESLQTQLQPHFLFNSLNAIAELVHRDPDAADEMLAALASLLRLSLDTSGEQLLPLRRELEFVERYLAIERVRFGDRLRFASDIPPETLGALVPTFLLQPLVENAVRHGLEPSAGQGLLLLRARREGERLWLSVSDNGIGLPGGKPAREGIGLANTRARLRELFGDAARLDLRDSGGLTVEASFPFRLASDADPSLGNPQKSTALAAVVSAAAASASLAALPAGASAASSSLSAS